MSKMYIVVSHTSSFNTHNNPGECVIVTLCRSVCLWFRTLLWPWRLGWGTGFQKVCNIYIGNGCHVLCPSCVPGTMGSPDICYPAFLAWRAVRKPLPTSCYMRKLGSVARKGPAE